MRTQSKRWFGSWTGFAALAAALAVVLFGIYSYRHRFVRVDADLLSLLPGGDETTFFINAAALRKGAMLQMPAGARQAQEADYAAFIRETRFDYTTDVDAVAGASDGNQIWMAVRGRFDWKKLQRFATNHGGSCRSDICKAPTSTPGRWASFVEIQPNVLGLGVSADGDAAEALKPSGRAGPRDMRQEPLWMKISSKLLREPMSLPQPVRIFAISLQSAQPVVLSLAKAAKESDGGYELRLEAQCPNQAAAETIRNQLEIETKMLKLELTRERRTPNPADLTGLLTAGTFRVVHDRVIGTWLVGPELIRALE